MNNTDTLLPSQTLWFNWPAVRPENQGFSKLPRWFSCSAKFGNQYSRHFSLYHAVLRKNFASESIKTHLGFLSVFNSNLIFFEVSFPRVSKTEWTGLLSVCKGRGRKWPTSRSRKWGWRGSSLGPCLRDGSWDRAGNSRKTVGSSQFHSDPFLQPQSELCKLQPWQCPCPA